jgi:pimeloyl-[acyl-carrier protein] methyl ester esterase
MSNSETKLAVHRSGIGPPLVLIHGWGMNSQIFEDLIGRWKSRWHLHAVDLPGHGASGWPPAFSDIGSLTNAVSEALPPRAIVLGWSLGALVALQLAHAQPQRVSALVLVSATARFLRSAQWPMGTRAAVLEKLRDSLLKNYSCTLADFLQLQVRGSRNAAAALAKFKASLRDSRKPAPAALQAGLDVLRDSDLTPLLAQIQQPSLCVFGEYDRIVAPQAGLELAHRMPRARAVLMRRAAHAPFLADLDEFTQVVDPFLESIGAGA